MGFIVVVVSGLRRSTGGSSASWRPPCL